MNNGNGSTSYVNETLTPLLNGIAKKDDDARIVGTDGSAVIVETELDLASSMPEAPLEPPSMLDESLVERATETRPANVELQVAFTMFAVNAIVMFAVMLMGYIPYWLLAYDERSNIAHAALGCSAALFLILYMAMLSVRSSNPRVARALIACWALAMVLLVGSVAAVVRNLGPLQTASALWAESVAVIAYVKLAPRSATASYAGAFALISGIVVWALGWIAFAAQRDWITAVVSGAVVALGAVHAWLQVKHADRYDVSLGSRTLAIVQFYGDPVLWCLAHLRCCCCRRHHTTAMQQQNNGDTDDEQIE